MFRAGRRRAGRSGSVCGLLRSVATSPSSTALSPLGTRLAPAQWHLPRWCRRRGTGTLRTVAARVGDGRNGSRIVEPRL